MRNVLEKTDIVCFEETDIYDGYRMLDAGYLIPDTGFTGFVYKNLAAKAYRIIFAVL